MSATDKQKKWKEPDGPVRRTNPQGLERWLDSYHLSRLERYRYFDDLIPRSKGSRDPQALSIRR